MILDSEYRRRWRWHAREAVVVVLRIFGSGGCASGGCASGGGCSLFHAWLRLLVVQLDRFGFLCYLFYLWAL